jgi:processive 1,2-diacylglycerol beta-glucosyltransferase
MPLPRVLILSVSAGAGHVRAAQALCAAAAGMAVETMHLDVMDFVPPRFRRIYTDLYISMVGKYPQAWGFLYRGMHRASAQDRSEKLRRWFERRQARTLLPQLRSLAPDAIVCTHFMPAELLSHYRPAIGVPVYVQITDFDLHRLWVQPGVDGYFVGNEEIAFGLRAAGVAASKIHITGLPIMPAFAQPATRAAAAALLGLQAGAPTVLLMGGGAGLGNFESQAERLLAIDPALQVIALTGKNTALLQRLQPLAQRYPGRLLTQGATPDVERFMACADLVVTKSGGLTSAECLAMGLPMVITAPIPGQEERNADYLVELGAALKAADALGVEFRVRRLLAQPLLRQAMAARARAAGRPDAAAAVMRCVLAQIPVLACQ